MKGATDEAGGAGRSRGRSDGGKKKEPDLSGEGRQGPGAVEGGCVRRPRAGRLDASPRRREEAATPAPPPSVVDGGKGVKPEGSHPIPPSPALGFSPCAGPRSARAGACRSRRPPPARRPRVPGIPGMSAPPATPAGPTETRTREPGAPSTAGIPDLASARRKRVVRGRHVPAVSRARNERGGDARETFGYPEVRKSRRIKRVLQQSKHRRGKRHGDCRTPVHTPGEKYASFSAVPRTADVPRRTAGPHPLPLRSPHVEPG